MKKLMLTATAAVLAGAAFAVETYDYKSSVKHTYLKEKTVQSVKYYVKYTKTSTLQGYLVQDYVTDMDGVLDNSTATISSKDLQPGNRCFLVVQNKSAEAKYKFPRIVPGVIEAKWYNDKGNPTKPDGVTITRAIPAQGIIYLGGEIVTALRGTTFNALDGITYATGRQFGDWKRMQACDLNGTWAAWGNGTPTIGIDDYWFTSCYLFGKYNQPSWKGNNIEEFSDAWMNLAGLGKAKYADDTDHCCGQQNGGAGVVLESLSGSVKAGLYLCSETGENTGHTAGFTRKGIYEDQLWLDLVTNDPAFVFDPYASTKYKPNATDLAVLDLWTDGNLDTRSTDVGYGTFTLKRTTKLDAVALTEAETKTITTTWGKTAPANTELLLTAIKGAMVKLDKSASLFGNPVKGNSMINYSFYNAYLAE